MLFRLRYVRQHVERFDLLFAFRRRHIQVNGNESVLFRFARSQLLQLELTEQLDEPLKRLVVSVYPNEVDSLKTLLVPVVVPLVVAFAARLQRIRVAEPNALQNAGERGHTDAASD